MTDPEPSNIIDLTRTNWNSLTTDRFYNVVLSEVSDYYHSDTFNKSKQPPTLAIREFSFIEATVLPLILCLGVHLHKYHKCKIKIILSDDPEIKKLISFLLHSRFIHIATQKDNDYDGQGKFQSGAGVFEVDERWIGDLGRLSMSDSHQIRRYTLENPHLQFMLGGIEKPERKRDYLLDVFEEAIGRHFRKVFAGQISDYDKTNYDPIEDDIAELITNSLFHSDSDCFVFLQANRFKISYGVADIGIGFNESMVKKEDTPFYKKEEVTQLLECIKIPHITEEVRKDIFSVFSALYFSLLKAREGLIDLIFDIVLNFNGSFHIHNVSSRITFSTNHQKEIQALYDLRVDIYNSLMENNVESLNDFKNEQLINNIKKIRLLLVAIAQSYVEEFNKDLRNSSLKVYKTKFPGVHIEVEIPNSR